jgi:hypothetical protein
MSQRPLERADAERLAGDEVCGRTANWSAGRALDRRLPAVALHLGVADLAPQDRELGLRAGGFPLERDNEAEKPG